MRASRKGRNSQRSPNPLVSTIIPAYNHAEFLGDAIESVLRQTYPDIEIIVVDDGSTDQTPEVAGQYGKNIRYIRQENQGLSAARNTGIRAARGKLIGLLDADDLYEPEFVTTLVSILGATPSVDAVYCRAQTVDVSNRPLPEQIGKVVPSEELYVTLLEGGFFPPHCMFAHKYCYEQTGLFDEAFQGCADWDLWLRFSKQFVVVGTNEILVRYRVLPESMSKNAAHMLDDRIRVVQKHFADELESFGEENNAVYRKALAHSYLSGAYYYLQSHDEISAYACLRDALCYWPELSTSLETVYRLGLGAQPVGFRNDFHTLDLAYNTDLLFKLLDQLMADEKVAGKLAAYRRLLYANAFYAMGLMNYGARQFKAARSFLLRAALSTPNVVLNRQYFPTIFKSLLGARLVTLIHRAKQHLQSIVLPTSSRSYHQS